MKLNNTFFLCNSNIIDEDGMMFIIGRFNSEEEAYLAAFDYNCPEGWHYLRILERKKNLNRYPGEIATPFGTFSTNNEFVYNVVREFQARTVQGTMECQICGYDRPHCHSRKEVLEGTVDTRTSIWWFDAMKEMQGRRK